MTGGVKLNSSSGNWIRTSDTNTSEGLNLGVTLSRSADARAKLWRVVVLSKAVIQYHLTLRYIHGIDRAAFRRISYRHQSLSDDSPGVSHITRVGQD